ncbi:hypothetical protein ACFSBZ_15780 [Amnibacterium flavum]|uniref:Uncharacterized protein n=1 Tax=Amnibacterium flavum TaxID=2173173 RepID=A0A2V1HU75_9MICO|nr:hypothetical protein [Amnibacterium flavum]PVZ96165.1 hypothetical protein DDQ50_06970 [Amnibacterium flavum]
MEWLIVAGVAVAAITAMSIAARGSSRPARGSGSIGSGMFGVADEIFAPARHEAQLEVERQTSLPAPAPSADDDDRGIYEGRISIRVNARADR